MEGPGAVAPGTTIGQRYRLEALLGEGAFGAVYRALDEASGARVALKIISPRSVSEAGGAPRVQREAELVSWLQHPNSVRIVGSGSDAAGWLFIAFELLDGRPLDAELRERGALSEARAASIVVDVLAALEEAHSLGIVHRDIKPGNIFLARSGTGAELVKVLDFGLAKSTNPGTLAGLTQAGAVMGTPLYMAPEQITAQPVTPRTDLFALGIVLAEILFGRSIYGDANTLSIITARAMGHPIPIPPFVQASRLGAIVARATEIDPARRFASATEMRMAIQAAMPALAPSASIATSPTQHAVVAAPSSHPSRLDLAHSATLPGIEAVAATPATITALPSPNAATMAVPPQAPIARPRSNARVALLTGGAIVLLGGVFAAGLAAAGAFSPAPQKRTPKHEVDPPSAHTSGASIPHTTETAAPPPVPPPLKQSQSNYLDDIEKLPAIRKRDVPPGGINAVIVQPATMFFTLAFPDNPTDAGTYVINSSGAMHAGGNPGGQCAIDFDAIDFTAMKRTLKEAPAQNGDQIIDQVRFFCVQFSHPVISVEIQTSAPGRAPHTDFYDAKGHLTPGGPGPH